MAFWGMPQAPPVQHQMPQAGSWMWGPYPHQAPPMPEDTKGMAKSFGGVLGSFVELILTIITYLLSFPLVQHAILGIVVYRLTIWHFRYPDRPIWHALNPLTILSEFSTVDARSHGTRTSGKRTASSSGSKNESGHGANKENDMVRDSSPPVPPLRTVSKSPSKSPGTHSARLRSSRGALSAMDDNVSVISDADSVLTTSTISRIPALSPKNHSRFLSGAERRSGPRESPPSRPISRFSSTSSASTFFTEGAAQALNQQHRHARSFSSTIPPTRPPPPSSSRMNQSSARSLVPARSTVGGGGLRRSSSNSSLVSLAESTITDYELSIARQGYLSFRRFRKSGMPPAPTAWRQVWASLHGPLLLIHSTPPRNGRILKAPLILDIRKCRLETLQQPPLCFSVVATDGTEVHLKCADSEDHRLWSQAVQTELNGNGMNAAAQQQLATMDISKEVIMQSFNCLEQQLREVTGDLVRSMQHVREGIDTAASHSKATHEGLMDLMMEKSPGGDFGESSTACADGEDAI
eukprot:Clim_evm12s57 gene=Clim_evmTU12s57